MKIEKKESLESFENGILIFITTLNIRCESKMVIANMLGLKIWLIKMMRGL